MMKYIFHSFVFVVLVFSSVPSFANFSGEFVAENNSFTLPSSANIEEIEGKTNFSNSHNSRVLQDASHSLENDCMQDKEMKNCQMQENSQSCDEDSCCSLLGCVQIQSFYYSSSYFLANYTKKVIFTLSNTLKKNSIAYLLKRPPRV